MPVPILALSPLQHRLLRELDLTDLPEPEADPASYTARGLDADAVREEALPTLLWAGLVESKAHEQATLAMTPSGAAALRDAECDELTARLSAVASFADTIAHGAPTRQAGYALKRLAEGIWSLEEAERYVRAS
ncbi:hypothetical protein [Streptomyces sp. NPDC046887]|uniref:hypothetical protein n=1 Tax=Streptomyces sp. NPDC046887 TaxID=3155472 RepID=UPI0034094C79